MVDYSLSRKLGLRYLTSPASPPEAGPNINSSPGEAATAIYTEPSERTPLMEQKLNKFSMSKTSVFADMSMMANRTRTLLALSYASASGTLSGMCLLFAKSGVELLLLTIAGHNQFWRWEAWVLLLGLIVLALLQLWYMHKSLTYADPTIVCPRMYLVLLPKDDY